MGFSGRLNTAFIERVNLTVRHGIAALARRTWATAQQSPHLLAHLEWWRAYYHFVRPHESLRVALCSRANEVASVWRNATDNGRQRWQRGERTDDGQHARCSLAPCRRFPLESHSSQMWLQCHVARKSVNVPAEELGWSLTPGRGGLSGLPTDEKTSPKWVRRRLVELSTMSHGSTLPGGTDLPHVLLNGAFRNVNAQLEELTTDPFFSPESVVPCNLLDQGDGLLGYPWLERSCPRLVLPKEFEALTMPPQKCLWLNE